MNIWLRRDASRANVSVWGQSLSQGRYQPTYQQARKGFIYFITLPIYFITLVLGLPWHSHISSYFHRRIYKAARVTLTACKCSARDNSPTRDNSILAPKSKIWSQYRQNQRIMTQKTISSFTIFHIFALQINYFSSFAICSCFTYKATEA